MSKSRIWILDGHNLIFQVPHLKDLQVSGRRSDARRELEHLLLAFAGEQQEEVVVVYDGNAQDGNPDTRHEGLLQTTYSLGFPEEVADHRILYLARQHGRRHRVCVVTSDVRTLANELDSTVTHLSVAQFWSRHIERAPSVQAKQISGDYSDIEAEFLRRDRESSPQPVPAPPARTPVAVPPAAHTGPADPAHGRRRKSADPARMEEIRRKKERGRMRQQKRLKRYGKK